MIIEGRERVSEGGTALLHRCLLVVMPVTRFNSAGMCESTPLGEQVLLLPPLLPTGTAPPPGSPLLLVEGGLDRAHRAQAVLDHARDPRGPHALAALAAAARQPAGAAPTARNPAAAAAGPLAPLTLAPGHGPVHAASRARSLGQPPPDNEKLRAVPLKPTRAAPALPAHHVTGRKKKRQLRGVSARRLRLGVGGRVTAKKTQVEVLLLLLLLLQSRRGAQKGAAVSQQRLLAQQMPWWMLMTF